VKKEYDFSKGERGRFYRPVQSAPKGASEISQPQGGWLKSKIKSSPEGTLENKSSGVPSGRKSFPG
jgi:hypothetical protein